MLASHNTFTYLTPKKWWMRLINFAARCQSNDIDTQYSHGARFFDIRIKNIHKDNDENIRYDYGHTVSSYPVTFGVNDLETIIVKYPDIRLRVVCEDGSYNESGKELFTLWISVLKHRYEIFNEQLCNVTLGRNPWIANNNGNWYGKVKNVDHYSRSCKYWWQFNKIRWPRLENKLYDKPTSDEIATTDEVHWHDFI